jgi:phosphotransferase system HPr (HPr) family protein
MASKEVTLSFSFTNREAAHFVQNANKYFKNAAYCRKDGRQVNAKSLLGILSLCAQKGEKVTFYFYSDEDVKFLDKALQIS